MHALKTIALLPIIGIWLVFLCIIFDPTDIDSETDYHQWN
jgi:hypothetical protein